MERNELIHEVLQAAAELTARQLWLRFSDPECFAVRVPSLDAPLLASVGGDPDGQSGIVLFRGPDAAAGHAALLSHDGAGDDTAEKMDMLSVSTSVFGEMDPKWQAFLREGGLHPQNDEQVPYFLVKPPHRRLRMPDDSELALFLIVLRAVVAADQRELLKPATLDDPDGVCVVTLGGNLDVAVSRERLHRKK